MRRWRIEDRKWILDSIFYFPFSIFAMLNPMTKWSDILSYFLVTILSLFLGYTVVLAATTFGENVSTDGTVTFKGTATSSVGGGFNMGPGNLKQNMGNPDYAASIADTGAIYLNDPYAIDTVGNYVYIADIPIKHR